MKAYLANCFVQVLFGGARIGFKESISASGGGVTFSETSDESNTNGAVQVGGGVNVWLSPLVGVRAGFDYRRVFGKEEDAGKLNIIRVALGIIIPIGR